MNDVNFKRVSRLILQLSLPKRLEAPNLLALLAGFSITRDGAGNFLTAEQVLRLQDSIALLHSARAATRLAALVDARAIPRSSIGIAALSPAVADAAGPGWATIAIAANPTDIALIEAALIERARD